MAQAPLCIIPARGGSKRFPRKNVAMLAGKPLVAHAVETARRSGIFDAICVSSDDEEVLDVARACGASLPMTRPVALAGDDVQVKHVCVHVIETLADRGRTFPAFAVLLPTSPLRTADDVCAAYRILMSGDATCCMSLVPFAHPPQRAVRIEDGVVRPSLGVQQMKPAQQLESWYRHDGTVLFVRTEAFMNEREFYGSKVVPYFVPRDRSVDIDDPIDLTWAEFLLTAARVRA